jgi:FkbM family methyltransferase
MKQIKAQTPVPDVYVERLEKLAELRGETLEEAASSILKNVLTRIPNNLRDADRPLADFDVTDVGVDQEGDPFVRMSNGRIFYDYFGKHRSLLMYLLMRDKAPRAFGPDTYSLGIEARRLYAKQPPKRGYPHDQNVVTVDAGAYVGYKAIAFLDALGPNGKVIAIELAPENYRLLKKNIKANGLEGRIVAHNLGVWSDAREIPYSGTGWMQFTIAEMDGKQYPSRGFMQTDTLDNIFDASNVDLIHYLNIQVNGAEIEALSGLQRWFPRVQRFRIAAYYKDTNGHAISRQVIDLLEARGCKIESATDKGSITALNTSYVG